MFVFVSQNQGPLDLFSLNALEGFEIRSPSGMFAKPLTQIQICHVSMEKCVIIRQDTQKRCKRSLPSFNVQRFRSKALGT